MARFKRIPVLVGERFGRLVTVAYAGKGKDSRHQFLCRCDCGNETIVLEKHLRNGNTKSCGCLKKDVWREENVTHGLSKTRIYRVWATMKDRCFRPNSQKFKDYGNRGITVCDEWKDSFEAFYGYVSKLPHYGEEGYSLDRINNDGNYEPGNVRWATAETQSNNRRCSLKAGVGIGNL